MKNSLIIANATPSITAPMYIAILNMGPGMHDTIANASQNYFSVRYSYNSIWSIGNTTWPPPMTRLPVLKNPPATVMYIDSEYCSTRNTENVAAYIIRDLYPNNGFVNWGLATYWGSSIGMGCTGCLRSYRTLLIAPDIMSPNATIEVWNANDITILNNHSPSRNLFFSAPLLSLYAASIITAMAAYLKPVISSWNVGLLASLMTSPAINITMADGTLKNRNATSPPRQLYVRLVPMAMTICVEVGPGRV